MAFGIIFEIDTIFIPNNSKNTDTKQAAISSPALIRNLAGASGVV